LLLSILKVVLYLIYSYVLIVKRIFDKIKDLLSIYSSVSSQKDCWQSSLWREVYICFLFFTNFSVYLYYILSWT